MPWFFMSPDHQQPWYWLHSINGSLSSTGKGFSYPCHLQWYKMQTDLCHYSVCKLSSWFMFPLVKTHLWLLPLRWQNPCWIFQENLNMYWHFFSLSFLNTHSCVPWLARLYCTSHTIVADDLKTQGTKASALNNNDIDLSVLEYCSFSTSINQLCVACFVTSHYLNQSWFIANSTDRWNFFLFFHTTLFHHIYISFCDHQTKQYI